MPKKSGNALFDALSRFENFRKKRSSLGLINELIPN